MDVVVQPSVPWMSLNDQIKDSGLFFPVDPGPSVSDALSRFQRLAASPSLVIRVFANDKNRPGLAVWSARVAGNSMTDIVTSLVLTL